MATIDGNDEELSRIFGIELLATKNQRQKLEDASQIIEPESLKDFSDIQLEKDHKLVCVAEEKSNLYRASSVFNVCLSF